MSFGLTASGKRTIGSGSEYEKYFTEKPQGNEVELMKDGSVYDTLKLMKKVVNQTLSQTKSISPVMKGNSREATCRNIWNFLYHNIQYKKDSPTREQLRTPARSWKDRKSGVDCDCFAIFSSSILTNLNIPHAFRMAGYKGDYQHVYVVVPKTNSSTDFFIIDPVTDRFNYEVPYAKKHDHMNNVSMLNGFGDCKDAKPEILKLRKFMDTQEIVARGGVPAKEFLTQAGIPFVPTFDKDSGNASYVVCGGPTGLKQVPTIISQSEANQLKSLAPAPSTTLQPTEQPPAEKKAFPWWWWAIAGGALILLTGSDQEEVKSGLDGPGKLGKRASKKLKTIRI
jgi:hypothetical protein